MKSISVSKFKKHCLSMLKKVARTGKPILLTKRGKPLARITSATLRGDRNRKFARERRSATDRFEVVRITNGHRVIEGDGYVTFAQAEYEAEIISRRHRGDEIFIEQNGVRQILYKHGHGWSIYVQAPVRRVHSEERR